MKVTQQQLTDLLQKVGVKDVEIVENESDSDFDHSTALDAIDSARSTIITQKHDKANKEEIERSIRGEMFAKAHSVLAKKLNVSRSQLDKCKDFEEALSMSIGHYQDSLEGDRAENDKRFNEMVANHNAEKEKIINEANQKYSNLEDEYRSGQIVDFYQSQLKDAPTTWDRSIAAKEIMKFAKEKYDVKYENGEVKYYEKGTNRLALNAANNDNVKHLDLAKEFLAPRNGWETDMRKQRPDEGAGTPKKVIDSFKDRAQTDKLNDSWKAIEEARAAATQ